MKEQCQLAYFEFLYVKMSRQTCSTLKVKVLETVTRTNKSHKPKLSLQECEPYSSKTQVFFLLYLPLASCINAINFHPVPAIVKHLF